ncbi:hypothetical protein BDN70DRAFT_887107 [Pholiota conissans]|uniref:Uncharacterized protein n=1 Tax=Pholiota conissans TaxID=109636 RepID=A0A9P5YPI5_9AGAR|nr:hypothetical protein BDN70DRAFT_887107 [Pholiota conissans]
MRFLNLLPLNLPNEITWWIFRAPNSPTTRPNAFSPVIKCTDRNAMRVARLPPSLLPSFPPYCLSLVPVPLFPFIGSSRIWPQYDGTSGAVHCLRCSCSAIVSFVHICTSVDNGVLMEGLW